MMNMILAKVFTTFVADEGGWPSDKLTVCQAAQVGSARGK